MQAPWWWSKTETRRSDIYEYFNVNFNVFFKLKSAFVGKWTLHAKYKVWSAQFSNLLSCNDWQIVADISKDFIDCIFMVEHSKKRATSPKNFGNHLPADKA